MIKLDASPVWGKFHGHSALQALNDALSKAKENLFTLSKYAYEEVVPVLEAAADRSIQSARPPRNARYVVAKLKTYGGTTPLVRTGHFKEAMTQSSSSYAYRDVSSSGIAYGTQSVEYASFLKFRMRPGKAIVKAYNKAVTRAIQDASPDLDVEETEP